MKAAVLFDAGDCRVEERPDPQPGPEEVLIRVRRCGVCGTDRSLFLGTYPAVYPVVIGHELSGDVVALGTRVGELEVGMRVTVDPNFPCGRCEYCRSGASHLCDRLSSMGVHRDGGDANFVVCRSENVYPVPPGLTYDEAAFCEPLACAIHGVDRAQVRLGDTVVVLGGGPMGNLIAQCAAHAGAAQVIVSEPAEFRRNKAAESGATCVLDPTVHDVEREVHARKRTGADVVFEVAGVPSLQESSLALVRRGGTVVFFGVGPEEAMARVSPFLINERELSVLGSFNNPAATPAAIEMLSSGRCQVRHLITHEIGLREFDGVFELFGQADTLKIMVETE